MDIALAAYDPTYYTFWHFFPPDWGMLRRSGILGFVKNETFLLTSGNLRFFNEKRNVFIYEYKSQVW